MAANAGTALGAGGANSANGTNATNGTNSTNGLSGPNSASTAAGTPQQSGGLVLVDATSSETPVTSDTSRDAGGYLRVVVVGGGIKLPEAVKADAKARPADTR